MKTLALILALGGIGVAPLAATTVLFSGTDLNVGLGSPLPNAAAANQAFLAAAGPVTADGFESQNPGFAAAYDLLGGLVLTMDDYTGVGVTNDSSQPTFGFATEGAMYLQFVTNASTNTATFQFSSPVTAFGLYFTGVCRDGYKPLSLTFNDGSPETILGDDPDNAYPSAATFLGFTTDIPVSSVQLVFNYGSSYYFGIDNVQFSDPLAAPEPATGWFTAIGLLLCLASGCRRALRAVS